MVVKLIEEVEGKFQKFFLNDVCFDIEGKIIKKGKLINVSIKDFFLEFKLEVQKGFIKSFEVPYPYELMDSNSWSRLNGEIWIGDKRLGDILLEEGLAVLKEK